MPALLTSHLVIAVRSPADRLLLAGCSALAPVLDELGEGVLLIGGLATAAWVETADVGLPPRPTRDVDLGVNRRALRLTARSRRLRPLLEHHGFMQRPGDDAFRFVYATDAGEFLLDLLLPSGASRDVPPLIEHGLDSMEAPGLAYAIARGRARLRLTFLDGDAVHELFLPIITRDSAFVMKAALVAGGTRVRQDRRITDTADAAMLAAACAVDAESVEALRKHRRQSEVRRAIGWLREALADERGAAPRRVEQYVEDELAQSGGAAWAVRAAARLLAALD